MNLERAVRAQDRLDGHIAQGHVDGVGLTKVTPVEDGFTAAIIPHTAAVTTLGSRRPGDAVNIEVDVIAKHVERMLAPVTAATREGSPSHASSVRLPGEVGA